MVVVLIRFHCRRGKACGRWGASVRRVEIRAFPRTCSELPSTIVPRHRSEHSDFTDTLTHAKCQRKRSASLQIRPHSLSSKMPITGRKHLSSPFPVRILLPRLSQNRSIFSAIKEIGNFLLSGQGRNLPSGSPYRFSNFPVVPYGARGLGHKTGH